MTDSIREQLVGYLLGALEPDETRQVEEELDRSPQLRGELHSVANKLQVLGFPEREDEIEFEGPPRGLALRTCDMIDWQIAAISDGVSTSLAVGPKEAPVESKVTPASCDRLATHDLVSRKRTRGIDYLVAGSVLVAAFVLAAPAIWKSREDARNLQCQNNLREIGIGLTSWAQLAPDGRVPRIESEGPRAAAGMYAPLLVDRKLVTNPATFVCASVPRPSDHAEFRVPPLEEIDSAPQDLLAQLHRMMGGNYGYNLGFVSNGQHVAPKFEGRSDYVLMSDSPSNNYPGRRSANHGGKGQNILYEDNSVRFVVDPPVLDIEDDLYLNRSGIVAAGEDSRDIVIGESWAKPFPTVLLPRR